MVFQEPTRAISIGMLHPAGFNDVPEARFISDMAAGFMSSIVWPGMFIPGMFIPGMGSCAWASAAIVITNVVITNRVALTKSLPVVAARFCEIGKENEKNQIRRTMRRGTGGPGGDGFSIADVSNDARSSTARSA